MRRAVDRFGSGALQFDAFNRAGIATQWFNIDGPQEAPQASARHPAAVRRGKC